MNTNQTTLNNTLKSIDLLHYSYEIENLKSKYKKIFLIVLIIEIIILLVGGILWIVGASIGHDQLWLSGMSVLIIALATWFICSISIVAIAYKKMTSIEEKIKEAMQKLPSLSETLKNYMPNLYEKIERKMPGIIEAIDKNILEPLGAKIQEKGQEIIPTVIDFIKEKVDEKVSQEIDNKKLKVVDAITDHVGDLINGFQQITKEENK